LIAARNKQKITKEKSTGTKHKWKTCRVQPRVKKAVNPKSSEAESFKHMKINILHTSTKHVVKDDENQNTIKLNVDGNITCNNH
jgi:hypothetical protein